MNTKSFLIATVAGGIAFFLVGFLFYGVLMVDFFRDNAGSASGVMKEPANMPLLFLGELIFGALYAYIFTRWANISTFAGGAKAGSVIGFLTGLGYNLINFSTANIHNLTASLTDAVLSGISGAIVGGIIGWVIGRTN